MLGCPLAWVGPSLGVSSLDLEAAVGTPPAAFFNASSFHNCHARRHWMCLARLLALGSRSFAGDARLEGIHQIHTFSPFGRVRTVND